jgi:hypothetical protein
MPVQFAVYYAERARHRTRTATNAEKNIPPDHLIILALLHCAVRAGGHTCRLLAVLAVKGEPGLLLHIAVEKIGLVQMTVTAGGGA